MNIIVFIKVCQYIYMSHSPFTLLYNHVYIYISTNKHELGHLVTRRQRLSTAFPTTDWEAAHCFHQEHNLHYYRPKRISWTNIFTPPPQLLLKRFYVYNVMCTYVQFLWGPWPHPWSPRYWCVKLKLIYQKSLGFILQDSVFYWFMSCLCHSKEKWLNIYQRVKYQQSYQGLDILSKSHLYELTNKSKTEAWQYML